MSTEAKICPVCGKEFAFITERKRGNNYYRYVVHKYFDPQSQRIRRYECYLGPVKEKEQKVTKEELRSALEKAFADSVMDARSVIEDVIDKINDIEKLQALHAMFDELEAYTYRKLILMSETPKKKK